jgi:hypothetical protein
MASPGAVLGQTLGNLEPQLLGGCGKRWGTRLGCVIAPRRGGGGTSSNFGESRFRRRRVKQCGAHVAQNRTHFREIV